jgi:hypothetical protein
MNLASLLAQLIDIERAIASQELATVRRMVIDAQECVLGLQRQATEEMRNEPGSIRRVVRIMEQEK